MCQVLEGLLVETERWREAFQLLKASPQATQRVLEAYAAWLVEQGRGEDAYNALRYRSSAMHNCRTHCWPPARLQNPFVVALHAASILV